MTAHLQAGDQAPDLILPTGPGETIRLHALKGRKVVLYFYPKDDTEGCTAEALAFNAQRAEFDRANAQIIGISPDSLPAHEKFKRKHALALMLASDEPRTVLEAYGVWKEKAMYGRKFMGVERTTVLVDTEGRIARIWRKVRVPGHVDEVLKAARAL
jgi:peroxiredoxin Q/BCP